MSAPKIVKDYKVEVIEKNGENYIVLTLKTEEGEERYLLEWGYFTRNLAVDIMKHNSEISVRKRYSL
ncbi:MAG: hypothetical protein ACXQTI_06720 [Candidatus Nezhaarchaeales archaeon]